MSLTNLVKSLLKTPKKEKKIIEKNEEKEVITIPYSRERDNLFSISYKAAAAINSVSNPDPHVYNGIEGIAILAEKEYPNHFKCSHYVFQEKMNEPWNPDDVDLFYSPNKFLKEKGYIRVKKPQNGDVVAYGRSWDKENEDIYVKHWGIYQDGEVVSKWGPTNGIFKHKLDLVPPEYGDKIVFFRKVA